MADEEKYSEEEFGFSDDTLASEEQEEEEVDLFGASEEVEDVYSQAAEASSGNPLLRYALFGVGLIAMSFGGYQLYNTFMPSTPASAFDQSGNSLVSKLSKKPEVLKSMSEMKMPESEPAPMLAPEVAKQPTTSQVMNEVQAVEPAAVVMPEPPAVNQVAEVVSQAAEKVVVRHEPSPAMLRRQDSIENSVRSMHERLVQLEDKQNTKQDSAKNLQQKITQVNNMLRKLDDKLAALDTEVDKIHNNVKEHKVLITKKIEPARQKRAAAKSARMEQSVPKSRYYIQALVPGRAWIKSKKGSTITVRKGSRLTSYGVVRDIDVVNGRILTTSGRVIRFHPSER